MVWGYMERMPGMPLNTTLEIAEPTAQPIGPRTKCAAHTANTKLQKGTTIICTTEGTSHLKKRSK